MGTDSRKEHGDTASDSVENDVIVDDDGVINNEKNFAI